MLATLLPAPLWLSLTMVALILSGSVFTVAAYADDIRASRLRQHGLTVPTTPSWASPPTDRRTPDRRALADQPDVPVTGLSQYYFIEFTLSPF